MAENKFVNGVITTLLVRGEKTPLISIRGPPCRYSLAGSLFPIRTSYRRYLACNLEAGENTSSISLLGCPAGT